MHAWLISDFKKEWMDGTLNGSVDRIPELFLQKLFVVVYTMEVVICYDTFVFAIYLHMCLAFHQCVELINRERFPGSKPAKEKPFRMYKDNTAITVKLTKLEDGWELDKTNDTQV